MRTSRTRTLYHLSLAGLALLALRPVDPLVRALDVLLAPSAVLSHLCAPLAWMGGRPAIAGEGQEEAAYAAQLALEQAVLASAEPQDPSRVEKLAGVRALRAEVSGRPRDDRDRIWLRLAQAGNISSLRTGDAVVSGDAFIGTVDVEASRLTAQVGVVEVANGKTTWIQVPGDPREHYLARMEWAESSEELVVQQLNRAQSTKLVMLAQRSGIPARL